MLYWVGNVNGGTVSSRLVEAAKGFQNWLRR